MKAFCWLQRAVVLAYHELLLSAHGGLSGLRDEGMFDSALSRPEQLAHYGSPTVHEAAAAYAFGLVRNHPFIDGNKRIGFASAVLFLERNGWVFTASEVDVVLQTLALAAGELDEAGYAAWLKKNSKKPGRRPTKQRPTKRKSAPKRKR